MSARSRMSHTSRDERLRDAQNDRSHVRTRNVCWHSHRITAARRKTFGEMAPALCPVCAMIDRLQSKPAKPAIGDAGTFVTHIRHTLNVVVHNPRSCVTITDIGK